MTIHKTSLYNHLYNFFKGFSVSRCLYEQKVYLPLVVLSWGHHSPRPRGHLEILETFLSQLGEFATRSSAWRPGVLLNIHNAESLAQQKISDPK